MVDHLSANSCNQQPEIERELNYSNSNNNKHTAFEICALNLSSEIR